MLKWMRSGSEAQKGGDMREMGDGSLLVQRTAAPVREQVLSKLREAIVKRTFAPGERLLERELTEMTGVSRTSVREALRQLEAEGFVEMVPNHGPIVARISVHEARELYEVRGALEALAVRLFTASASDAEVDLLSAAVDELEAVIDQADHHRLLEVKDRFYDILLTGAGNAVVARMLGGLHARITYLRSTTLGQAGRPRETLTELRRIVESVRARNPAEAERLCIDHVQRAGALAISTLQAEEGPASGAN